MRMIASATDFVHMFESQVCLLNHQLDLATLRLATPLTIVSRGLTAKTNDAGDSAIGKFQEWRSIDRSMAPYSSEFLRTIKIKVPS